MKLLARYSITASANKATHLQLLVRHSFKVPDRGAARPELRLQELHGRLPAAAQEEAEEVEPV